MRSLLIVAAQLLAVALVVVLIVWILAIVAGMEFPQGCGEVRDGVKKICFGPAA